MQPVSEATEALFLFLPYIIVFAIVLSVGFAYVFSRQITKPLLQLNQSAQSLAQLNFTEKIDMKRSDEIGELSQSINHMSGNLEQSLERLKSANEQLQTDIEKERAIEEKRREYFSAVSHELKSPITILKGQLEGMLHEIGPYKDREVYLAKSIQTTEEMESLLQNMMKLSKLERSLTSIERQDIQLASLINQTLERLEYFQSEREITVDCQLEDDVWVQSNEELLSRIMYNVIHNGFMYSPQGEQMVIRAEKVPNAWDISIVNTGATLSDKDLTAVFAPFYRVEKSRNKNSGGSGVGLYLVQQMAEALSYPYKLENTDAGVQFTLTVPDVKKS
ncbi:two-component sensor kinase [Geomicrobium sp. JCM 19037]|nr:two-component sensor kinase [Geomicrobium sp. JCM 19037]